MKKSIKEFTDKQLVQKADDNHIWLNGFSCINPNDEFKIMLADQILRKLEETDMLDSMGISSMIILTINKS